MGRYHYQAMFTIIGIVVALVAIMVGYTMHGGNVGVLIQINEFIILGGAGIGSLLANHHASDFFCDTLKVILTGSVGPHDLSEMMELDLEVAHKEAAIPAEAVQTVGDAMPGFGIVAAVLGIIITMGKIGGEAAAIGESVGASLVGTFLGIFLAYGIFAPISKAMSMRLDSEGQYMNCIRYALFSFARGESPITCVEFARRNIETSVRPGFTEMEKAVKG